MVNGGKTLIPIGFPSQDTSKLLFEDCKVPVANLLGMEGQGFKMMMEKLQQERLSIRVTAMASCRRALDDTIAYTLQRKAFGRQIAHFQNIQFKLAELATQIQVGQAFVANLIAAHVRSDDIVSEVSMGNDGRPICRSASSPSVSSSTAATAACTSTRSPRTTPTPPYNRSTRARTRS